VTDLAKAISEFVWLLKETKSQLDQIAAADAARRQPLRGRRDGSEPAQRPASQIKDR
jgi:hypothetical protein